MSKNVKRLFKQFKPDHYDVNIAISDDKNSFSGSVVIHGQKTGRPAKRLTFHQHKLKISDVQVERTDKKGAMHKVEITRVVAHKTFNEIRLHTKELNFPGAYKISMNFEGNISDNMDGIYPSNFEHDGKKKKLIVTQFESHHAREAFPCIDEPEAKATFKLSLSHSKDEVALSNTELESESINGEIKTSIFENTPIMSTYLLAFVVGELKYKEALSVNNVRIRTYSVPHLVETSEFALKTAVDAMNFYEDYYDIPFPLSKCDFVALPDFASGAMENWGLITFREQLLLCDEYTSLSTKQYIAIVVAHELTHQWFGNLVTMRWWTDLWLNEGFASWMEYLAVDNLFPEWHLWRQFAVDEQQTALKADALEYTHPIEVPVHHPDEIRTIFDVISYQKGASVIHMLNDYLGPEQFRDGLRHYLKTHAYKNTDTVDLWQALEDVTKKPIKKFMGAWTSTNGFPILKVSSKNDHLVVEQSRFVTNPKSKARNDKTLWPVPLLSDGLKAVDTSKKIANIPLSGSEAPIKINSGQTGFYRVDYSHEMQVRQLKALADNELTDIDRMGLLSDGFETTKAGYQPVSEYLELLEYYKLESSLAVWEIIAGSLGSIRNILSKDDKDNTLRDLLKPFISKLVEPQLSRLGWEEKKNEIHLDSLLRPLIIGLSASSDNPQTVEKCIELYKQKISKNLHINPDLRPIIYSTAARLGGQKEYEQLLNLYKTTHSNDEKLSITSAMTSFRQPEINTAVLELLKSGEIRLQDIGYWIAYSFMNRHARNQTWTWLKENWQWLKTNIGTDLSFARTPVYAARNFSDPESLKDYINFFSKFMEPLLDRSYKQGLEIIETNTAWRERDHEIAIEWFKKRD